MFHKGFSDNFHVGLQPPPCYVGTKNQAGFFLVVMFDDLPEYMYSFYLSKSPPHLSTFLTRRLAPNVSPAATRGTWLVVFPLSVTTRLVGLPFVDCLPSLRVHHIVVLAALELSNDNE